MAWSNFLLLVTFPLEGLIFFGTIMGWPNMVEVLKQLHVYEDLCDLNSNETEITNSIVNCNQRDVIFSTAGTIGGFSMNVMTLVFGLIVDKKGLFLSRSLITITVTVGLLCLMFTPDANWLMFPGIFLQSAGGYAFVLTNATMSTLFPKFAAIVLVLGQCLFQIASSYFRVLSIIFDSGVPYKWIIGANILLTIPVWIRTLFLFPEKRFELDMNVFNESFFGK
ncbi:Oidioi.mRNA.OKI2018_I69.PAR.g8647.t1.cds [Oikopleura dioica]|nr:Oidioi.mRNA.OKI2018_I69.PAR.g8647.t1.cds [Oikopleura dioica]